MRVLSFLGPPPSEIDVPTPHSFRDGLRYFTVTVPDDSLLWLGVKPGGVFVFLRGGFYDGHVHAASCRGELVIGAVFALNPERARLHSWSGGTHIINRRRVLGSLEMSYPNGLDGDSYLWRPASAESVVVGLGAMLSVAVS